MLKEIESTNIGLTLYKFKKTLEQSNKDSSMIVLEITKIIKKKITKRNGIIKLLFKDTTYKLVPNAIYFKNSKWYLEIASYIEMPGDIK